MENIEEKLKEFKIEEFIWIIYIGIIILSFYSNSLERKYYIYDDKVSKEKYRKIIILIFSTLIIIYLYFLKDAYDDIMNIRTNDSDEKKKLLYLSFTASLLITVSGFIFLYIAFKDENLDVELAFN